MTKATRGNFFRLRQEQQGAAADHAVRLGAYTYVPAPVHSSGTNGTLTGGGLPVPLDVTESLLLDFLDRMSALEADLARRWSGAGGWSSFSRAE
ncbi:hypothetical protein ACFOOM_10300 [Streptomyces echinoruber]|uniref:Uncharacterized protein n=1 Tax=Streptomyces echinoruber TaxID=68898 RepID=A0A918S1H2_9ACTN|nr:hypothetical protein [Streptomyces echinoruber]GHA19236.1 hypothetical protein GCM10010389_66240 [Streptomyces echinoruber]